jgi:hypothetical protein
MRLTNLGDTSYIQSGLRSVTGDGNILNIGPFASTSSIAQFDTQNAKVSLGSGLNPDPNSQKIQVSGNTVITGTSGSGQYGTTAVTFSAAGTTTLPGITGTVYNIYGWGQGGTGQGAQAGGEIEILGLTGGNISWSFAGGGASVSGNTGGNALYVNVSGVTGVAYGGGGGGGVTGAGGNATAVTGGSGGQFTQTTVEQLSFANSGDVLSNITIVGTSTLQTTDFLTLPAGTVIRASAEKTGISGNGIVDVITFPEGTTFSIEGTGITGSGVFISEDVTTIYSPYSNPNIGVAGVPASGVTGDGQQIFDGMTGITGSNVEFFNSSGIGGTMPVTMSGTVQSAFSGSGPVYIYLNNFYNNTADPKVYTLFGNCKYALVASGDANPVPPPPISASFSTTSQTSTVLPTYTTPAGTQIRTVSSVISLQGITGTTLGGAGDFGGGGGGYFGGGGGIVGGAGGNGSSFITGITGAAANNGSGTDGYRNRYNNYQYGGVEQPGVIVIETVNTSNVTPTLTVNGNTTLNGGLKINGYLPNSGNDSINVTNDITARGLQAQNILIRSTPDGINQGGQILAFENGLSSQSVNFPAGLFVNTAGPTARSNPNAQLLADGSFNMNGTMRVGATAGGTSPGSIFASGGLNAQNLSIIGGTIYQSGIATGLTIKQGTVSPNQVSFIYGDGSGWRARFGREATPTLDIADNGTVTVNNGLINVLQPAVGGARTTFFTDNLDQTNGARRSISVMLNNSGNGPGISFDNNIAGPSGPTGPSNPQNGFFTFERDSSVGYFSTNNKPLQASDFIIPSDSRLKENIVTVDSALDKVMKMRGVYFNKSDDQVRRIGVIAQEVEEVLPEVVHTDDTPEQMKAVSYANIVGLLIEAIKEQQEIIKKLM